MDLSTLMSFMSAFVNPTSPSSRVAMWSSSALSPATLFAGVTGNDGEAAPAPAAIRTFPTSPNVLMRAVAVVGLLMRAVAVVGLLRGAVAVIGLSCDDLSFNGLSFDDLSFDDAAPAPPAIFAFPASPTVGDSTRGVPLSPATTT